MVSSGKRVSKSLAELIIARLQQLETAAAWQTQLLIGLSAAPAPSSWCSSSSFSPHIWNPFAPAFNPDQPADDAYVDELFSQAPEACCPEANFDESQDHMSEESTALEKSDPHDEPQDKVDDEKEKEIVSESARDPANENASVFENKNEVVNENKNDEPQDNLISFQADLDSEVFDQTNERIPQDVRNAANDEAFGAWPDMHPAEVEAKQKELWAVVKVTIEVCERMLGCAERRAEPR